VQPRFLIHHNEQSFRLSHYRPQISFSLCRYVFFCFDTFLGELFTNHEGGETDGILLRAGVKFARQVAQTQPLSGALIAELSPGAGVNSDEAWDNWVAQTAGTEFHPSSTCAMLPLSQGGVVDTYLHVYGLVNVRVADSSVFPMQFAAHVRYRPFPSAPDI
jgi:choline dehydrogenase-like flavoprotein